MVRGRLQPLEPVPVRRVVRPGCEEGHEARSMRDPEGALLSVSTTNRGCNLGSRTVGEEKRAGEGIPQNPLADRAEDLHHAAEPDVHGTGPV